MIYKKTTLKNASVLLLVASISFILFVSLAHAEVINGFSFTPKFKIDGNSTNVTASAEPTGTQPSSESNNTESDDEPRTVIKADVKKTKKEEPLSNKEKEESYILKRKLDISKDKDINA